MNSKRISAERRKILNLIRISNRKKDVLKFYANETKLHKKLKFELFCRLQESGHELYTEVIFNNGRRCDLLALKEGIATGYEILSTETELECQEKIKSYPQEINWVIIKNLNDIDKIT